MENLTLKLIDQRFLPHELKIFETTEFEEVIFAIKNMAVRGSPAIGATAAYGMALASSQKMNAKQAAKALRGSRPTGYDLFFAVDFMLTAIEKGEDPLKAAKKYAEEVENRCKAIGLHGEKIIEDGFRILTHCNAGALATVDYGTALSPIRFAHYKGKKIFVYVDETRPKLQGAKLTAWELNQEGIDHAIIADNAAGHFMRKGEIDMVMVGADRITSTGDFANKIGTYEKAVLAKENKIPFYVAAPMNTFDFSLKNGEDIVIEERSEEEVLEINGHSIAPKGSRARNPVFDVTPSNYVTGFITERGILSRKELKKVRK